MNSFVKIIHHRFPKIWKQFKKIQDTRQFCQYGIDEIVFAGISLFLFKCGSRNAMDNLRKSNEFYGNYVKAFDLNLPDMDTVALVFEDLPSSELECLKTELVKTMINSRILESQRFKGMYMIAVDGTGLLTFNERHCEHCTSKTYTKNTVYFHPVLEAKLVTPSGFSFSICTEWIENETAEYNKQDCERKAFVRLAKKLKEQFPRLNICMLVDGLYPNNTFFKTCKLNQWGYIATMKDGNLKGLWKKIYKKSPKTKEVMNKEGDKTIATLYSFLNNLEHNGYTHNWIRSEETTVSQTSPMEEERFVYLTNLKITTKNCQDILLFGRLRWKIEKQGFDQQKNHGYNICHKYSRTSHTGMQNWYQACQIAHIINQLIEKSDEVKKLLKNKITIKYLWEFLRGMFMFIVFDSSELQIIKTKRTVIIYKQ